jgi:hypothetical protein
MGRKKAGGRIFYWIGRGGAIKIEGEITNSTCEDLWERGAF